MPEAMRPRLNLADIILEKIREKEMNAQDVGDVLKEKLDPKVVQVYTE